VLKNTKNSVKKLVSKIQKEIVLKSFSVKNISAKNNPLKKWKTKFSKLSRTTD